MNAFKCDGCGDFIEGSVRVAIEYSGFGMVSLGFSHRPIELCSVCGHACGTALQQALAEISESSAEEEEDG